MPRRLALTEALTQEVVCDSVRPLTRLQQLVRLGAGTAVTSSVAQLLTWRRLRGQMVTSSIPWAVLAKWEKRRMLNVRTRIILVVVLDAMSSGMVSDVSLSCFWQLL
ncbi:PREDICTED: uncharacterized protein LOC104806336 [Tarenaya hassleriana]|uniref:uncharacterized protein LOC104806336 n=1 Tax=Tarenaya hassleriana TaxID=28532 RepID=UPI00053C8060|nr:PREDICTED: uncharacterized protein LOC104806336 [Tarenaya hassleriana]